MGGSSYLRKVHARILPRTGPRHNPDLTWALLHLAAHAPVGETGAMRPHRYPRPCPALCSAFTGYRFPPEVITLAVRWYLRFGLSYTGTSRSSSPNEASRSTM
jgi:hypothetical protein